MHTKIFVNLPVKDLQKSIEFFTKIGYRFNPQFTDENATCMIISENIYVMLLVEKFFKTFIPNTEIADATKVTESLTCLSVASKEEVDNIMSIALAAGATETRPVQDMEYMYGRSYADLDGHIWELGWMNMPELK
jgi:predicted lactoylglutathione lyase